MDRFTPNDTSRANAALQDNLTRAEPRIVASYALIGAILLFGGLGYALDRWFTSGPWGLLAGLLVGFLIGFANLIVSVRR
jgi:F0F1-type ATP synthase assembly protein I